MTTPTSPGFDMDRAIEDLRIAVRLTGPNDPLLIGCLHNLGCRLHQRYERASRDEKDIVESIEYAERAVSTCSTLLGECLGGLALSFVARYNVHHDVEDLERAVKVRRQAVQYFSEGDAGRPAVLNDLGSDLGRLYDRTRRVEDIEEAVRYTSEAAQLARNDADRAKILCNLTIHLIRKHERLGDDLEPVIKATREALRLTDHDQRNPARALIMSTGGVVYLLRYKEKGIGKDLSKAVQLGTRALEVAQSGHPDRTVVLNNLGHALVLQYEATGSRDALEQAIKGAKEVLESTPADHPCRPWALSELGLYLSRRYQDTGVPRDIDEAIRLTGEAVELTPEDDPKRPVWLDAHAGCLADRYKTLGTASPQDMERAVDLTRGALQLARHPHPHRATLLNNLGIRLGLRYEKMMAAAATQWRTSAAARPPARRSSSRCPPPTRSRRAPTTAWAIPSRTPCRARRGSRRGTRSKASSARPSRPRPTSGAWSSRAAQRGSDDLDEAISSLRESLRLTGDGHVTKPGILNNLGNQLGRRYQRTGKLKDLDEAIHLLRDALARTGPHHRDRAMWLQNLGSRLCDRFRRTAERPSLQEAILAAQQSVEATLADDAELGARWGNLGNAFEALYDRTGDPEDLEKAIRAAQRSLEVTPETHTNRGKCLNNLSGKLGRRFEHRSQDGDIEEALRLVHEALGPAQGQGVDDHLRANLLSTLAAALSSRYKAHGRRRDIMKAVRNMAKAVRLTPPQHPDRAARSNILGNMLVSRFEATEERSDLDMACSSYLETWNSLNAIPFHRVAAASRLVRLLPIQGRVNKATQVAKQAIRLLPTVSTRSLGLEDRQWTLSTYSGMAADACSLLLEAGKTEEALQHLETGRAVILGERMNDRNDVSELKEQHPKLAHQYERLRDEVSVPLPESGENDVKLLQMRRRRSEAVAQLESCIKSIRGMKGWNHFLGALTAAEMKQCAGEGIIVVVNVTLRRSDAILVSSRGIVARRLPDLFQSQAAETLRAGRHGIFRDLESEVETPHGPSFLEWLWSDCVKGIVKEIENSPHLLLPQATKPRVWWIGVGTAGVFPFHAAGSASPDDTMSHVISSYTPTIKALSYSRSRVPRGDTPRITEASILVVTMPTTPGQRPLNVDQERLAVSEACRGVYEPKSLVRPTARKVLASIPGSDVVHFACHGSSDPKNPSESNLLLVKWSGAARRQVVDKLDISSIAKLPTLGRAWIAYLSACSTAEVKAKSLIDEGLHISSAFQVIGFPHVIGTLWSVDDDVSICMAGLFYQALAADVKGTAGGSTPDVAKALHTALNNVREEYPNPEDWAAYIHSGA